MTGARTRWLVALLPPRLGLAGPGRDRFGASRGLHVPRLGASTCATSANRTRGTACSCSARRTRPARSRSVGHDPLDGPRHERGDRGPQALRLRRQPHGRQEQQRQPRRRSSSSTPQNPADPYIAKEMGPPFEGQPAGVLARAARVALAERADRPAHQLRRQRRAPVPAPSRSSHALLRHPGANAPNPQLLYENTLDTHEFYIWEDPKNPKRALMFAASAGSNFQIYDISPVLKRTNRPSSAGPAASTAATASATPTARASTPSRSPTTASARTSRCSRAASASSTCPTSPTPTRPPTPTGWSRRRPTRPWPGPGAHSAVKLWNKDWVYVSDEVYGTVTGTGHGCPWGWARFIDVRDETRPVVARSSACPRTSRSRAPCSTRRARPTPPTTRR